MPNLTHLPPLRRTRLLSFAMQALLLQALLPALGNAAGFNLRVAGDTTLNGAVIASTASADHNQLTTAHLTTQDLQNNADYKSSSLGFSVGTGGFTPNIGLPAQGNDSGRTQSAVALGTITLTAGDATQNATQLANLNRDTAHANDGSVAKIFDQAEIANAQELGTVFGEVGFRVVGDIAQAQQTAATQALIAANAETDPALRQTLLDAAQADAAFWAEGGTGKVILHGLTGYLQGQLGGGNALRSGLAALSNEAALPYIRDYLVSQGFTPGSATFNSLLKASSGLVGGLVAGQGGAATAVTATVNNYLRHDQIDALKKALSTAKTLTEKLAILRKYMALSADQANVREFANPTGVRTLARDVRDLEDFFRSQNLGASNSDLAYFAHYIIDQQRGARDASNSASTANLPTNAVVHQIQVTSLYETWNPSKSEVDTKVLYTPVTGTNIAGYVASSLNNSANPATSWVFGSMPFTIGAGTDSVTGLFATYANLPNDLYATWQLGAAGEGWASLGQGSQTAVTALLPFLGSGPKITLTWPWGRTTSTVVQQGEVAVVGEVVVAPSVPVVVTSEGLANTATGARLAEDLAIAQSKDLRIGTTLPGANAPVTVTAESNIGGRMLVDTNQTARPSTLADPNKPTLISDLIAPGNPNSTMANAHAEIGLVQQAYDAGLTQGQSMTIVVRGEAVCSYCLDAKNLVAAAERAGLNKLELVDAERRVTYIWTKGSSKLVQK